MKLEPVDVLFVVLSIFFVALGNVLIFWRDLPLIGILTYIERLPELWIWVVGVGAVMVGIGTLGLVQKNLRPLILALYALATVLLHVQGVLSPGASVMLLGIYISALLMRGDYNGIKGAWKALSDARKLYGIIILLLLLPIFLNNVQAVREDFKYAIVTLAMQGAGEINEVPIPPQITPEERQILMERLYALYPDLNTYPPETREQIISNYLYQYQEFKKAFINALRTNLKSSKEKILQELENIPIVQQTLKFSPYIYAAILSVFFSTLVWVAGIIAFILLIPFYYLPALVQPKQDLSK